MRLAHTRLFITALLIAVVIIMFDQLSKWAILEHVLSPERPGIEITSFFNIVMVWNYGVSFGLFAGHRKPLILTAISLAIVLVLLIWLARNHDRLTAWAIGIVIGGAIGNVIDRLRFGAVADFLDFHIGTYHWPAFNIADSAIFIGVVLLVLSGMFKGDKNDA